MDFAFVRDELGLSESALSKQLSTLEGAGYVVIERPVSNHRRRVRVRLTPQGQEAFQAHVQALRAIVAGAGDAAGAWRPQPSWRGSGEPQPGHRMAGVPFIHRNLKKDLPDVGANFDGAPDLEFRMATQALELEHSGLTYQRVPPGYRFPYGHTHRTQEEV